MNWTESPFNLIQRVDNVYVLPRAEVALYEDNGGGAIGTLAGTIKQLENIRITDRFIGVRTRFTGIPYRQPFHLDEEHEITADGIWDLARIMERNRDYILCITIRAATMGDGSSSAWARIYYYLARTDATQLSTRDGNEFVGSQTITAGYRDVETGSSGTPTAPKDCDDL